MKHLFYTSFAALFIVFSFIACDFYSYKTKVSVNDSVVKEKQGNFGFSLKGNEKVSVSNYPFRNFSAINASGAVKVYYSQDSTYSIRVEEKGEPRVIVEMKDRQLNIKSKNKNGFVNIVNDKLPRIYVNSPYLNELKISGASEFSAKKMAQSNMVMKVSGASKVNAEYIDCSSLDLHVSGASKVSTDVKAPHAMVSLSGASKADVSFLGKAIEVHNSGASKMTLKLDCEELNASNSGASKCTVSGYVDKVDIKKSGASKVDTSELNPD